MAQARVVVIGGGQAGLAVSHELAGAGIDHTVLERARVGESWRGRWDSFCLNTPNWTVHLPGSPYTGSDPEGFMPRDEVVGYLERYAESFEAPVRTGVEVTGLRPRDGGFTLRTSEGDLQAEQVVVSTGAYQRPHRPDVPLDLPPGLLVIDADQYRSPGAIPPGRLLIVGSGQTGCQVAEDLIEAGRDVVVACGRAPWGPRRLEGRDLVTWMAETAWFDHTLESLPSPQARLTGNILFSGANGGHDLNYRVLQEQGAVLAGHLAGIAGGRARFADDLADSVAFSDARYADLCRVLREELPLKGLKAPGLPEPPPFRADAPLEVALDGFGAVIFTSGFRPDYRRWIDAPAFDDLGFPLTDEGASTVVPGLYFAGVHFLRKRKSSLIWGVGEDAAIVARKIAERLGAGAVPA